MTDSDGKPAARVKVMIMYPQHLTALSADDGSFRFDNVKPGPCTVDATDPDGRFNGERVIVRASQTTTVKLVIATAPGRISGVVVDAGGKPLGDAFVVAAREGDGRVDTRPWLNDGSQVLAGVDGTFTITRLVAGSYTLRAYRTGGGEATIEHVPVGGRVRIQIKPTGSIAGTVRTPTRRHGGELVRRRVTTVTHEIKRVLLGALVEPLRARDHRVERLAVVRRRVLLLHLLARSRVVGTLEDVLDLVLRLRIAAEAEHLELEVECRGFRRGMLLREVWRYCCCARGRCRSGGRRNLLGRGSQGGGVCLATVTVAGAWSTSSHGMSALMSGGFPGTRRSGACSGSVAMPA